MSMLNGVLRSKLAEMFAVLAVKLGMFLCEECLL